MPKRNTPELMRSRSSWIDAKATAPTSASTPPAASARLRTAPSSPTARIASATATSMKAPSPVRFFTPSSSIPTCVAKAAPTMQPAVFAP
jgi:hypothetical protein